MRRATEPRAVAPGQLRCCVLLTEVDLALPRSVLFKALRNQIDVERC